MDIITKEVSPIPKWTEFEIKKMNDSHKHHSSFIMGDYLVILLFDRQRDTKGVSKFKLDAFSFDLLDHSVQEAGVGFFESKLGISFVKYDESRIICYQIGTGNLSCITVESFKPLKVKLEEIDKNDHPVNFTEDLTAQIYKDNLYLYGSTDEGMKLLSFHLKNREWKVYETTGEDPEDDVYRSFIYEDNFCVYAYKQYNMTYNIFMLNLNEMKWTLLEHQGFYRSNAYHKDGRAVYKNHLVFLQNPLHFTENALCLLNLGSRSQWSTFETEDIAIENLHRDYPDLLIYKNLILTLASKWVHSKKTLIGIAMTFDSFGICAPKSAEEEKISSLFLNESESDISLKIEGQIIPAHKQVLAEKSSYFKDKIIESEEGIIEIQDCESDVFKEYLRFVYQDTVNFDDIDRVFKLHSLARKYSQEDLRERCVLLLSLHLNIENFYKILDFAQQENVPEIKRRCLNFLETPVNEINVTELIEYLDQQEDLKSREDNKEFRNGALNFVLDSLLNIEEDEEEKLQVCTNFLLKNIDIDTLPIFVHFLNNYNYKKWLEEQKRKNRKKYRVYVDSSDEEDEEDEEREKNGEEEEDEVKDQEDSHDDDHKENEAQDNESNECEKSIWEEIADDDKGLLPEIGQIKEATLNFIHQNAKTLLSNKISENLLDFIFASLFMSPIESDLTLKIEDQLVPAHKQILVKKSRYFEMVFNSGMAESNQDVIVIQEDCEYEVFKEYLRFVYQGVAQLDDSQKAIKVHKLADKYLQEDLCKQCVKFLSKNIEQDNVYEILDFAREKNFPRLKSCCFEFIRRETNVENVIKLIKYLGRQDDPEFKEHNRKLKIFAVEFVLNAFVHSRYRRVSKEDVEENENFLFENVGMDTLAPLAHFLGASSHELSTKERTTELKEAVFRFIHENVKTIMTKEVSKSFSIDLFRDFTLYMEKNSFIRIPDMMIEAEMSQENSILEKKGKKRMEPSQNGVDEENPSLKKTKK